MQFFFDYGAYILTPLHIIVCLILIAVVLLQTGKGADFASALGGGGTQTAFGPRGVENTLSRLTKIAAVLFMVTSLSLSIAKTGTRGGALRNLVGEAESAKKSASPTPAAPASATAPALEAPAQPATPAAEVPVDLVPAVPEAAGSPAPASVSP